MERFEGNGRMSKAVINNGVLYLSGQVGRGQEYTNFAEEVAAVLRNCEILLDKYGSDKEHILTATCYLNDVNDFEAFNAVYDKWVVPGHEPTRTCLESKLAGGYKVEVTLVAAVK